ncbi:MAG: hypothetical protein JXR84_22115 [Anaerolineae bacterium]|nr:hypothetical protein [Anaerolineae bacterium]
MAKKTKKRKIGEPRLSERQLYQPGMAGVGGGSAAASATKTAATLAQPDDEDLVAEYRYVLTDLKKIAWLAMAMLVLLIVLAFVVV